MIFFFDNLLQSSRDTLPSISVKHLSPSPNHQTDEEVPFCTLVSLSSKSAAELASHTAPISDENKWFWIGICFQDATWLIANRIVRAQGTTLIEPAEAIGVLVDEIFISSKGIWPVHDENGSQDDRDQAVQNLLEVGK